MNKADQFHIKASEVNSSNRIREDFGDMLDLMESIRKHGILQPIAVYIGEDEFVLLDGGRRLKACQELKMERIPAFVLDKPADELTAKEIELEATEQHLHFSFVERNKQIEKIHELMLAKHGAQRSTNPGTPGWTLDDTAKKLGRSRASISNALQMAEAARLMPEIEQAKTESEARKLYKQTENAIARELLMIEVREKRELTPEDQQKLEIEDMYIVGDVEVESKKIDSGSLDLVEIDWPFAVGLDDYRGDYEDIKADDYIPFVERVLTEAKRVLKPTGWFIVWYASEPWAEIIYSRIHNLGFRVRRVPGMWIKPHGETKRPEYYLGMGVETFYYAGMPDAKIVRKGRSNLWDQAQVPSQYKVHRTEKPVKLYDDIFTTFVLPKVKAAIFFAGSGSALLSCNNQGIDAIGFDLKEEYKRGFVQRIHEGVPGHYQSWGK